eukprot:TRINITY_DN5244_c0_g1_i1.p1 TRINITY_DN5244_c0_g1~~TRINITY_DN5244_c0_g1_i1.p1  ORF type:complete len:186 (+),score=36.64 TRINITY_DN5244_c0_g1_i1:42-560(+)
MSANSTFSKFNVALVTGGGGGLGKAIAQSLIKHGKKVIIAGRNLSNLEETAKELGPSCVGTYSVDAANIAALTGFAQQVLKEHPEVDCLINNAGVMGMLDFAKGAEYKDAEYEVNLNILAPIQLTNLLIPHFSAKPHAVVMNITSGLAYVPAKPYPVYCATKVYVHSLQIQM